VNQKIINYNLRGKVLKLTPLDIKRQEFRKVMRGYDAMEVDAFLDMVADEYENLHKSKNEGITKIKQLEERLKEYQDQCFVYIFFQIYLKCLKRSILFLNLIY